ncbi:hypothetical protein PAXRUDRAFT_830070 [Paxillus rubicundulus Ve08.2h10]|uniref:Uncharacterized protein n=1 Tax=Paxillus rubicundulus Ve08.2h10 TaxID=930991 RepID=A0A0D0E4R1_9AGAM|nr:hypothetical protein PAXRUDRAFT_830070 [Paxillus rubicundulus Ve08.2h10]
MPFVDNFLDGQRRAEAVEPTSTVNPSYIPTGPEAAPPTSTEQSVPPTLAPQATSGITAYIAVFLSLFGLVTLAYVIWRVRRRHTNQKLAGLSSDERPSKNTEIPDIEAGGSSRLTIPVTPQPGVRWTPQVRSISGPLPVESPGRRSAAALSPKRARSPPPTYTKPQNPFADSYPKSAPARTLSFADDELRAPKGLGRDSSPPVTPHALAVSGMQTRESWSSIKKS